MKLFFVLFLLIVPANVVNAQQEQPLSQQQIKMEDVHKVLESAKDFLKNNQKETNDIQVSNLKSQFYISCLKESREKDHDRQQEKCLTAMKAIFESGEKK